MFVRRRSRSSVASVFVLLLAAACTPQVSRPRADDDPGDGTDLPSLDARRSDPLDDARPGGNGGTGGGGSDARPQEPDGASSQWDAPVSMPDAGRSEPDAPLDGRAADSKANADARPVDGKTIDARPPDTSAPASPDAGPFNPNSQTLPLLWIDTGGKAINQGTKTPGTLKVLYDHENAIIKSISGRPIALDTPIGIDIHGATSAGLPKKSYGLELRDTAGMGTPQPFLGLPQEADFILHSGGQDPTVMRNVLTYALAREGGRYAPRTVYAEVYINGSYNGLYAVVEKIKRDKNRVDLPKPALDTTGDLTGGYIFKMDLGQGSASDAVLKDFVTDLPMVYTYVYPKYDEITAAQKSYLTGFVKQFEAMTKGGGFADATNGYRKWIDVGSWVDFALFQELTNNIDAYQKSLYMQKWAKAAGDKIALGPLWDFDYAYGVAGFRDGDHTDIWAWQMNRFGSEPVPYDPPGSVPHVPAYWEKLWMDGAFQADLKCRWNELRKTVITTGNVNAKLDTWWKQLALVQPRENSRWGYLPAEAVPNLKSWVSKRIGWLDANMPGTCNR